MRIMTVMSCLELSNEGLGEIEILLGLFVLKMKVGQ